jgi:hypothetical protein
MFKDINKCSVIEAHSLNIVEPVAEHIDQEDISDDDEGKNRSLSQDDADFYFGSKEDSVYGYRDRSQSDV